MRLVRIRALWLSIGALIAVAAAMSASASQSSQSKASSKASSADAGAKVDLNTASEKDLESLPGVGPATAKKIIAGRPYSSVGDLSKAGVSASAIKKITSLVTVSGETAAAASTKAVTPAAQPKASSAPTQPAPAAPAKAATAAASQGTPGPGMVWVNLGSGVYHYSNSRFYGKTKSGKYMPEADAIQAGYHAAKNEKKPQ